MTADALIRRAIKPGTAVRVGVATKEPIVVTIATGRQQCELDRLRHSRAVADCGGPAKLSHISKMVLSIVKFGGPSLAVDTTVFEMWVGSLSTHPGLAIPVS